MTDPPAEALHDLVARSRERIKDLRRTGDLAALLDGAKAAAEEIELRAGKSSGDAERQALLAVKRFTYNAAADCWPGWSVTDEPPDTRILLTAQELARRSAGLVGKLGLGALQEGTGIWLCGAFDLALDRRAEAESAFVAARERYAAAGAAGLVLLMEGYIAIVRQIAGHGDPAGEDELGRVSTRIAAGGFEDGAEWVEQLRIASKVFAP